MFFKLWMAKSLSHSLQTLWHQHSTQKHGTEHRNANTVPEHFYIDTYSMGWYELAVHGKKVTRIVTDLIVDVGGH